METEEIKKSVNGKRVYLSGPISALPYKSAHSLFWAAKSLVRDMGAADVFNPTTAIPQYLNWDEAMAVCTKEIRSGRYDVVAVVEGTIPSRGRDEEVRLANDLRIPVIYL